MMQQITVALLALEGFDTLDVAGPMSALAAANDALKRAAYKALPLSLRGGLVASGAGLWVQTTQLDDVHPDTIHALLVAGGSSPGMCDVLRHSVSRQWIRDAVRACCRFGSLGNGTILLAELGCLAGRRVAARCEAADALVRRFPGLAVERDALFIRDGKAWTGAGGTTGIDMTLAMVEADFGAAIAGAGAKSLLLYMRRPGYQSQLSPLLRAQDAAATPFADLTSWIASRLNGRLDVASLAAYSRLSVRTFHRKFRAATGQTPADFVETLRLDTARSLLATGLTLKAIAQRTGFHSTARLTSAFERRFGMSPRVFRLEQGPDALSARRHATPRMLGAVGESPYAPPLGALQLVTVR